MKMTMNLTATEATEVLDAMAETAKKHGEDIDLTILSAVVDSALEAMGISVSITEDEDEDDDEADDFVDEDEDEDEDEADDPEDFVDEDEDDDEDGDENDVDTVLSEIAMNIRTLPDGRRVVMESDVRRAVMAIKACIETIDPHLSDEHTCTVIKETWEFFVKKNHIDGVAVGK